MKPVMFCKNSSGTWRWSHKFDEMRSLDGGFEKRTPLFATTPTG